jgi:hypothetical protein
MIPIIYHSINLCNCISRHRQPEYHSCKIAPNPVIAQEAASQRARDAIRERYGNSTQTYSNKQTSAVAQRKLQQVRVQRSAVVG